MTLWNRMFSKRSRKERLFHNEQALHLSRYGFGECLNKLDLLAFPLVEDFIIKLEQTGTFGIHLYFYSDQLGRLASFPWWDNVEKDLSSYTSSDIPVGDFDEPYSDLEQGWQIIIFEDENFVYIMEGQEPCCTEFPIWFRVTRDRYYNEWMRLIREFNPA